MYDSDDDVFTPEAITYLCEWQLDDVDRAWNALVNDYNLEGAYV